MGQELWKIRDWRHYNASNELFEDCTGTKVNSVNVKKGVNLRNIIH